MVPASYKTLLNHTLLVFIAGVLGSGSFFIPARASAEGPQCVFHWQLALCQPASFRSAGKTYAEMEAERARAIALAQAKRRAAIQANAFVKITKDMKNPNSVRIPLAQAPTISAKTRQVNGKRVCADKNDKGKKSKQDKDVHIDRECCLDPDEVPNPRCYYPQLGR